LKRSRSSKDLHNVTGSSDMDPDQRQQLRASLLATSGSSKSSLVRTLAELQRAGMLKDSQLGVGCEKSRLQHAAEIHAKAMTPYGTVVQKMDLGNELPLWDYVHPLAFMYYLSSISQPFGELLASMIDRAPRGLRLVLYGDEMTPGNPLRTDKGRQLWNFYYAFLEMPSWLLHRKDGWFVFGALRTTIVADVSAGVSALVVKLLKVLFVNGPANLTQGIFILHNGGHKVLRASFAGFIGDEKGLKEFFGLKGASGNKPCVDCQNLLALKAANRIGEDAMYAVGLDCDDLAKCKRHTNETFMLMIDRLAIAKDRVSAQEFQEMEVLFGVKYHPEGLLFCPSLRGILKPLDQYIRDWQHTLVSAGMACSEIAALLRKLQEEQFPIEAVCEYATQYRRPKSLGARVPKTWFTNESIGEDHMKGFSSNRNTQI
jgi:hypothetical protein